MPWFTVDDSFPSHPKTLMVPRVSRLTVIGLWTACGTWSAHHLTDGLIPVDVVAEHGGKPAHARSLVLAALWHDQDSTCTHTPDHCPGVPPAGSFAFHDWLDYQPSRLKVLAERDRKAAAGRAGGRASGRSRRSRNEAAASDSFEAETKQLLRDRSQVVEPPSHPIPNPNLQDLVCRRLFGDARKLTDDDRADLWQVWAETAGPAVDLETELRAWLIHNTATDLRNPGAALLGWLRTAAERATTTTGPGCEKCLSGWTPDEHGQPSEHRCTACRPHLRAVETS